MEKPKIEIINFDNNDIIETSGDRTPIIEF